MNNFQHFIITPFNVDIGVYPREKILDYQYLAARFTLFKQVCYPHVYHQTNQNFKWLVFFDHEIHTDFKKQIEELTSYNNFLPIYTPSNLNFHPFLVDIIKNYLNDSRTHLITSILDNDDAIAKSFVETIQKQFHGQDFEYINFPYGYMLRKDGIYLREYFSSPFISLIEKNDNFLTCKVINHNQVYEILKKGLYLCQIIDKPMWIQLVHDDNWRTKRDINAVPILNYQLDNDFVMQEFVKSYVNQSQIDTIFNYISKYIIINKYKISLQKRLRNFFSIFNHSLSKIYQQLFFKYNQKNKKSQSLTIPEIKAICLNQKSFWRKN